MTSAVIIRGHARTWNCNKLQNISFLNEVYDYPDWYVAMPNTGTVTDDSLRADFKSSNLVDCKLVNDTDYQLPYFCRQWDSYCPEYWRLAWLDYQISWSMRQYELLHNMQYTQVFFARPDCSYTYEVGYNTSLIVDQLEVAAILNKGVTRVPDQSDPELADDLSYAAGRLAAALIMQRYLDSQWHDLPNTLLHPNPCALLAAYMAKHAITVDANKKFVLHALVRPGQLGYTTWSALDIQTKIDLCRTANINTIDYQL